MNASLKLIALLLLTLVSWDVSAAKADLCEDPRILKEMEKPIEYRYFAWVEGEGIKEVGWPEDLPKAAPKCRSFAWPFRDQDRHVSSVAVAEILRAEGFSVDVFVHRYDSFALLPNGELLDLGDSRRLRLGKAEDFLFDQLDIDPARAGGTCCIDQTMFYDAYFERVGDRYCITYDMKEPFTGEFHDCGGPGNTFGQIGHSQVAVSWNEARVIGCRQLSADTGKACGAAAEPLETRILRDPSGSIYYRTQLRVRSKSDGFTYYLYRVDLIGGAVTLLEKSDEYTQR